MIDVPKEPTMTLAEAATRLGKSRVTVHRWASGALGPTLETIVVGGVRLTSEGALQRFFERLTEARANRASAGA